MSIKKAIIILVIIAVVGAIAVLSLMGGSEEVIYKTAKAELGNIIQTVTETGTVKADKEIDLNFLNSVQNFNHSFITPKAQDDRTFINIFAN